MQKWVKTFFLKSICISTKPDGYYRICATVNSRQTYLYEQAADTTADGVSVDCFLVIILNFGIAIDPFFKTYNYGKS